MRVIILAICTVLANKAYAVEECDLLGSLEADPFSTSEPVKFQDIQSTKLVNACTEAIQEQNDNVARYYLLRARGHLRGGSYEQAISDISLSHDMGYPAATFALATLYHFGDAMPQDLEKAASLYEAAYNNGVTWAARGLAILYEDFSFGNYNPELAKAWVKKFEGL
jgi:TPR repeat protein